MLLENSSGSIPSGDKPQDAAIASWVQAVQEHQSPFSLKQRATGLEVRPRNTLQGRKNRAVGLVFEITEGSFSGRKAVFFFKESQVPFSMNRFAYGTVILPTGIPSMSVLAECLDFAASGFHVEKRPSQLRRAVTFTMPEREEVSDE